MAKTKPAARRTYSTTKIPKDRALRQLRKGAAGDELLRRVDQMGRRVGELERQVRMILDQQDHEARKLDAIAGQVLPLWMDRRHARGEK